MILATIGELSSIIGSSIVVLTAVLRTGSLLKKAIDTQIKRIDKLEQVTTRGTKPVKDIKKKIDEIKENGN